MFWYSVKYDKNKQLFFKNYKSSDENDLMKELRTENDVYYGIVKKTDREAQETDEEA